MKRFAQLSAAALALTAIASGTLSSVAIEAASADAPSPNLPVITLAMDGKSVTVGGTPVSGAVDIRSTVTGEADASPTLFRLNPRTTFEQVFAAVGATGDPNATSPYGSIVFGGDAPKGTSDLQTTLTPGNYVALDFGPMNNNNNSGPPPHAEFTVTPATAPASLPQAAATVTAIDFRFHGASTLKNGSVVRAVNHGYVVHMVAAIGVKSAAQARKVMALLKAGKDNQAQKLANHSFIELAGTVSPGAVVQQTLHTTPGVYVLACFMDTQDGREHTQLGMLRMITVQ